MVSRRRLLTTRTGAAAAILADGGVLVSGGQVDGQPAKTLEVYDPPAGTSIPSPESCPSQ